MQSPGDPQDLIGWMKLFCERPGMWLVCGAELPNVNVGVLHSLILGYETALMVLGRPSEEALFREFVYTRRPDLKRSSAWYGGALFLANGDGDHHRVIAQILAWVNEFEQSRAV